MLNPVKAARKKRGQTLTQVAAAIGTDAGNLSRIENGKQRPSLEMAEKLAQHFGYEISEIQILYPQRFIQRGAA
jgi:transcriptional regulator with XRE-family HTH domain